MFKAPVIAKKKENNKKIYAKNCIYEVKLITFVFDCIKACYK